MDKTRRVPILASLVIFSLAFASLTACQKRETPIQASEATHATPAQGKRPMTMVDLISLPSLGDPQLSPDGRHLLYVLTEADWAANRRFSHIWRLDIGGPAAIQMTSSKDDTSPRWSPDGKRIAFLSNRDASMGPQIYVVSSTGGEARQLTTHQSSPPMFGVAYPRLFNINWSTDGRWIYFLASDPLSADDKARANEKDDGYAFDENYKQVHLWRVSASDGSEQRITTGHYSVLNYQLSRDGSKMVHYRGPNPIYGYVNESELWVMDAATGANAVQLTRNDVPEGPIDDVLTGAQLSPDNSMVAFLSKTNEQFEYFYKSSLFVMPATGGRAKMLLSDLPYEIMQLNWSQKGDSLFFVAIMGVHSELFQLDLATNKVRQLTDGEHTIRSWVPEFGANRHVLTFDQRSTAGDVWVMPLDGGAAPTQVTHVFDYLASEFDLPRQERTTWKGADGVTVEGLLYYPLGYQEGRRYPLVVNSHGGLASTDTFSFGRWSDYTQVLTAKGYAVLKTNYRGSGGYGDTFQRDLVGHYFNNSHLDVLAGVDHVIKMGIGDPDHLVKRGWSAGGLMTNKLITFTDRFKAASSGAGVVDWISFYGEGGERYFRHHYLGGTPWQKNPPIDNIWKQSPISGIANVKTPTIIFAGEGDYRSPIYQSVELYRALKANNVPTRLDLAPREGHGWSELRHQLFKMNEELGWFEKYAMGREYTFEKPPAKAAQTH
jgi:dipeptidyl aminopeptidase/acylaminoacyl peptidase